jgi:cytochrome c oxidase cbb3-type subunit II
MSFSHDKIEKNVGLMIVLIGVLAMSVGGLVEIVPLLPEESTTSR